MIIQPERGTRNINVKFYEMEMRQIAMLNEIFGEVELTKGEMQTLVWLDLLFWQSPRPVSAGFYRLNAKSLLRIPKRFPFNAMAF